MGYMHVAREVFHLSCMYHLRQLYVDVAATQAEGVGYILCTRVREHPQEK